MLARMNLPDRFHRRSLNFQVEQQGVAMFWRHPGKNVHIGRCYRRALTKIWKIELLGLMLYAFLAALVAFVNEVPESINLNFR